MGKKVILIILILLALAATGMTVLSLMNEQQSIGIIGGADGPTTILVSTVVTENPNSSVALYAVTAALLVAATVAYLIYRSRNRRD